MLRGHCSDGRLLSFLDAELDPLSHLIISRHLQSCSICSERLSELEGQIDTLSSGPTDLVTPSEVDRARNRFLAWARTGAVEFRPQKRRRLRFSVIFRAPVMAGMGAFVLIGGVTVWHLRQAEPGPPPPEKQIARSSAPRLVVPVQTLSQPIKEVARLEHATVMTGLPVLQPAEPSEVQLLETEVEALWLLHQAGACNGEPIEVTRSKRRVLIQGIVQSRARQRELGGALKQMSGKEFVRIELKTEEDLRAVTDPIPLAALPPQHSPHADSDSGFQDAAAVALRSMYPLDTTDQTRQRLVGVTNRAIGHAEGAIAEAWAIRRLGDRFRGDPSTLSAHSRELLGRMATEHLLALRTHVTDLNSLLAPMLSRMALEPAPLTPPGDLFAAVERLRRLVETSFVGNSPSLGSPDKISSEIASLSESLSDDLSDVDLVVARMFPEPVTITPDDR